MDHARAHKRSALRDEQILAHLLRFFGETRLRDIVPARIERYKQERLLKVSPATVNREVALLKHLFNLAERWGEFKGPNPVRHVSFLPEDNFMLRVLSEAEEELLLQHASPYLQDIIVFAVNTGLRSGEIFNLSWEEVDLEHNVVRLLVRKNRRLLEVPMNERAAAVVHAWAAMKKCRYVFYNPETGDRWKDLWLGLKKACRKAGLQDVTWHTFRHTFASRLTGGGADLVTVKELLGHSEISVTMRYAHTNREAKARAVRLLAKTTVTKQ
jgi:integrase